MHALPCFLCCCGLDVGKTYQNASGMIGMAGVVMELPLLLPLCASQQQVAVYVCVQWIDFPDVCCSCSLLQWHLSDVAQACALSRPHSCVT